MGRPMHRSTAYVTNVAAFMYTVSAARHIGIRFAQAVAANNCKTAPRLDADRIRNPLRLQE